jgi:hypothetical protein
LSRLLPEKDFATLAREIAPQEADAAVQEEWRQTG